MTNPPPVLDADALNKIADEAMMERGLIPNFPQEVLNEVEKAQAAVLTISNGYADLRDKLWCSIDNDDSRDLDQLTYAEKIDQGRVKLFVAVADVDSLVKKDSAIDKFAQHNTTSIYTPSKIYPMLPEKLSTDLTSLGEDEDRFAIVIEVIIAESGAMESYEVVQAYVHNHAKLAYPSVGAWLEGKGAAPKRVEQNPELAANLKLQSETAQRIKEYRHRQGALTLQTVELHPILANGSVVNLFVREPNLAQELIENLMISANVAVTLFLTRNNQPTLRRVVRTPKMWDRIVEIVAGHGITLPPTPDSKALEAFLSVMAFKDPEGFPELSITMIKLLGRGEYVAEMAGQEHLGHFDLALTDYAHTTAPNRRYPDLIMQRLLKAFINKQPPPYSFTALTNIAHQCTKREEDVSKVERRLVKSAAAMFLVSHLNETFDGIITGAGPKGTWIRLFNPPVEGRLLRGFERLKIGDRIKATLTGVDVTSGHIDFVKAVP